MVTVTRHASHSTATPVTRWAAGLGGAPLNLQTVFEYYSISKSSSTRKFSLSHSAAARKEAAAITSSIALASRAAVPGVPAAQNVHCCPGICAAAATSLLALLGLPRVTPIRKRDPKWRHFWRSQRAQQQLRWKQVCVHGVAARLIAHAFATVT